jgi:hypothetical protein
MAPGGTISRDHEFKASISYHIQINHPRIHHLESSFALPNTVSL